MSDLSFANDGAPLFLAARRQFHSGSPVIFGAGYDGTTSFRPGARFGPDAIRHASSALETYSPRQDADLEDLRIIDAGNLEVSAGSPEPVVHQVADAVEEILELGGRPVMLGGEHSLTAGAVRGAARFHPDLAVIQFDAHADLREDYLGERFSHACAMRRCLDVLGPECLLQVGIRSGTRDEFREMGRTGRYISAKSGALRERIGYLKDLPVYVTVDLDIFDPSLVAGTGTPEPGGISWQRFESLVSVLTQARIIGFDVMELAPDLDSSGISSVVAAKVVRELLLLLG